MHRIAFSIFGFPIYSYGIMIVIGVIVVSSFVVVLLVFDAQDESKNTINETNINNIFFFIL